MTDYFPCCICTVRGCNSTICPFTNENFAFEQGILEIINKEIPDKITEEEVSTILFKNCKKMSPKEVNLLISQIY